MNNIQCTHTHKKQENKNKIKWLLHEAPTVPWTDIWDNFCHFWILLRSMSCNLITHNNWTFWKSRKKVFRTELQIQQKKSLIHKHQFQLQTFCRFVSFYLLRELYLLCRGSVGWFTATISIPIQYPHNIKLNFTKCYEYFAVGQNSELINKFYFKMEKEIRLKALHRKIYTSENIK